MKSFIESLKDSRLADEDGKMPNSTWEKIFSKER